MRTLLFLTALGLLFLSGCAPLKFYSDPGLTRGTGLKYYTLKPYLQVERDLISGNVSKMVIVYMPDLEYPQYLQLRSGPGSGKADIKFSDGTISSLSMEAESTLSELTESFATLVSKGSAAVEDISKLKGSVPGASAAVISELYEVVMNNGTTSLKKIELH